MLDDERTEQTEGTLSEEVQDAAPAAAGEETAAAETAVPIEQAVEAAPPAPKPRRARQSGRQEGAAAPPELAAEPGHREEEVISVKRQSR